MIKSKVKETMEEWMRFRKKLEKLYVVKKLTLDVKYWKWLIFQFKWILVCKMNLIWKLIKKKKVTIEKNKIKKATNEYNWYYAIMMAILRNIELWKKGEVRRRVLK